MKQRAFLPIFQHTAAAVLLMLLPATPGVCLAQVPTRTEEQGRYVTYLLGHEVGSEKYALRSTSTGFLLTATSTLQDRHTRPYQDHNVGNG